MTRCLPGWASRCTTGFRRSPAPPPDGRRKADPRVRKAKPRRPPSHCGTRRPHPGHTDKSQWASAATGRELGPGRATLEFCRYLNDRLKFVPQGLKLRLVAITAGCPATLLENAPISFL